MISQGLGTRQPLTLADDPCSLFPGGNADNSGIVASYMCSRQHQFEADLAGGDDDDQHAIGRTYYLRVLVVMYMREHKASPAASSPDLSPNRGADGGGQWRRWRRCIWDPAQPVLGLWIPKNLIVLYAR